MAKDRASSAAGRSDLPGAPVALSEEDIDQLLDLSSELLGVFQPGEGLRWCNTAHRQVFGIGEDEVEGVDLVQMIHPDDRSEVTRIAAALAEHPEEPAPMRIRMRTGEQHRPFEWSVARVPEDPTLLLGAARDRSAWAEAEAARRTTEQILQAILDHATVAIFAKDTEGRYVLANRAFAEPLGLGTEQIVGRTRRELWPDAGADPDEERDRRIMASGLAEASDDQVPLHDGVHTILTIRFPLRDASGRVTGMAGVASDITDRVKVQQELREQGRLLDTIARACPDIVTTLDGEGRIESVSDAASVILGIPGNLSHEELAGRVHPDDMPMVMRAYGRLYAGLDDAIDLRYRTRHADGHWVTLDSRGRSVVGSDGRVDGVVVVSRDISDDLAFEAELRAAVQRAEQANQTKSTFLSRMSHELRTPLNSVLGFAQLLQMEDLATNQQEAIDHILQAGRHLLDLIDEVLDIARIETGHLDLVLEPVPVAGVVRDAVALTRPLAERHGVRVDVDLAELHPGAHVTANRQRLLQVLLNLLSNAAKYNHPGGRIRVAAGTGPRQSVRIAVEDTGPGIAQEDLPRLFEPFDRLGAEQSGVEGTGVGLTLSKHLVERMRGNIEVDSTPGAGSTFAVLLPAAATPAVTPAPAHLPEAPAGSDDQVEILHVEDNPANLHLVEQILERRGGVRLRSARTAAEGAAAAAARPPDLVLLDVHLPDANGEEVLDRLRADPATAAVPVVVVTADATPEQASRLLSLGAAAYVTKPLDVRRFLAVIDTVLRGEAG